MGLIGEPLAAPDLYRRILHSLCLIDVQTAGHATSSGRQVRANRIRQREEGFGSAIPRDRHAAGRAGQLAMRTLAGIIQRFSNRLSDSIVTGFEM